MADTQPNENTSSAAGAGDSAGGSGVGNAGASTPVFETQKQRWVKYGANVVIASVVVVLLAGLIVYLAQKAGRRIDTTEARVYSLKPQTHGILKDVPGKVKLVSLYRQEIRNARGGMEKSPYVDAVVDLLDEYRRQSNKIEVEAVDPVANPTKVDALINEVTNKYGGEVQKYRQLVEAHNKTYQQLNEIAAAETERIAKLPVDQLGEDEDSTIVRTAVVTIRKLPQQLKESDEAINRLLADKPPNYKGAVTEIQDNLDETGRIADAVLQIFNKYKTDAKYPEPIRQYMAQAGGTYEQIKKISEELVKQSKDLGELKLDDLRQSLRARDVILVFGDNDLRVINFEQVWPEDQQVRQYAPGQQPKRRFAGEQQVSSAILGLTQQKKTKVAFVRAGGPPLAQSMPFPFRGGPLSTVADRLRQYNFEVLEKDLSGMWAMQAQMQQMPSPPEPSDDQIKDAIWIVVNEPPQQQQNPMMPPTTIAPRVADHLNAGGSALIMFAPQADAMGDLMKQWGLEVNTGAVAVHQMIDPSQGRQGDMMEDALRYPFIFDIREYGDHLITKPLRSLQSLLVPLLVVKPTAAPAAPAATQPSQLKVTPIIPIPTDMQTWGETDIESLQNLDNVKYNSGTDVAPPLFGGAVVEKQGGGRLVVVACPRFAHDRFVGEPDAEIYRTTGRVVFKFPANAELFLNSVFWLAKMEPMIAISPAAMDVARIEPIGKGALRAWQIGGLLIGLPGAVVLAGALMYFARRD